MKLFLLCAASFMLASTVVCAGPVCARTPEVIAEILSRTRIKKCEDVTAAELQKLTYFKLESVASLKSDDFEGMPALNHIRICGPWNGQEAKQLEISSLPTNLFKGLTHVRSLMICNSQISQLQPGLLDDMTGLEEISLSGNKLKSVDGDMRRTKINHLRQYPSV